MHPRNLSIKDFDYPLPENRIAAFPLQERDQSKLLIYKNGNITEDIYRNISKHLPEKSFLVFNNTKVIKARILFTKLTGAVIEIFCLKPYETNYVTVFQKKGTVRWKCMIGGAGKWKNKSLKKKFFINNKEVELQATLIQKLTDAYVVQFSWSPDSYSFAEIIESAGTMPLPPYIKRKPNSKDAERYQTVYSIHEGSVAAPTAGLHFTEEIFLSLKQKNIETGFVTLHVGAGTFKPVKVEIMNEHEMHAEWMDVSKEFLEQLLSNIDNNIICVGTTSIRTVESLYWMGVKVLQQKIASVEELEIQQWNVYDNGMKDTKITAQDSLEALLKLLSDKKINHIVLRTRIIIAPGYEYKIVNGMVTNFHQPRSTLLLLVAAMIGDKWKDVYAYAIQNDFRFLSYGDGCLIWNNNTNGNE